MEIRVAESGLDAAELRLRRLELLLSDLRPFWPKLVPLFVRWVGRQFDTEGAFFGTPWAPLSPDYAIWKASRYPGKGILYAEGDLKRAAQSPARDVGPQHLTLTLEGWDKGDAAWHHEGMGSNPRRPIYPVGDLPLTAQAEVDRAAEEYVNDMVARLGL